MVLAKIDTLVFGSSLETLSPTRIMISSDELLRKSPHKIKVIKNISEKDADEINSTYID